MKKYDNHDDNETEIGEEKIIFKLNRKQSKKSI